MNEELYASAKSFIEQIPPQFKKEEHVGLTEWYIKDKPLSKLFTLEPINYDKSNGNVEQLTSYIARAGMILDEMDGNHFDKDARNIARKRLDAGIHSDLNLGWALSYVQKLMTEEQRRSATADQLSSILHSPTLYTAFMEQLEKYVNSTTISGRNARAIPLLEEYLNDNSRIADVGCSTGIFASILAEKLPDAEIHLADKYPLERIGLAKSMPFYAIDIAAEPLPTEDLDAITCFALLKIHLTNDASARAIAHMGESLKDGGIMILGYQGMNLTGNGLKNGKYDYAIIRKEQDFFVPDKRVTNNSN